MMKICLNQKISALSKAFHNGDISLADYRAQRRKEFEALNNHAQAPSKHLEGARAQGISKVVVQRIVLGTFSVIFLIIATVLIAKFLF